MAIPPLSISLFGPMVVQLHGCPLPPMRSRKGLSILAILVLRHQKPTDRAWLAGTLWPEVSEENALYNLRRNLSRLRAALGVEAHRLTAPTPRTLLLDLSGCTVDALEFQSAIGQASREGRERAVGLYSGPFMAGCDEEWALEFQDAFKRDFIMTLSQLGTEYLEQADSRSAVQVLQRLVLFEPLSESAACLLFRALADERDGAGLVTAYRNLRLRLHDELQCSPSAETNRLFETLRNTVHASRNSAAAILYEAKDPGETQKLDARAVQTNLRQRLTPIIGRTEELSRIRALIRAHRLVTILGSGGVGKTHLATEVARGCINEPFSSVWFVDLVPLSDSPLLAQSIGATLGLQDRPDISSEEMLALRFAEGSTLVVFDNCEHVASGLANIVEQLLNQCPRLTILTTSRQPISVHGEALFALGPLATPTAQNEIDHQDIVQFDAVRLFVERARESNPDFNVTADNAVAVAQICLRLDGVPLALELAAARVRVLTVESIAKRLTDRFLLLKSDRIGSIPHHQSLRSLIDWSYELLDPVERAVFSSLSVFIGDWSLEAAEAVCLDEADPNCDVMSTVLRLVDRSLVQTVQSHLPGSPMRYRLLESVREYAASRLRETGREVSLRDRHRQWYRKRIHEAHPHLLGKDLALWQTKLDTERDNMLSALEWTEENHELLEFVMLLVRYWWVRDRLREGLGWLEMSLNRDLSIVPPAVVSQAHAAASSLAWKLGDRVTAERHALAALEIAELISDRLQIARACVMMAILHVEGGRLEESVEALERALAIRREEGDQNSIANVLANLAVVRSKQERFQEAVELCREALIINETSGDVRAVVCTRGSMATAYFGLGRYQEAREQWEQCLRHDTELGYDWGVASSTINLGDVAVREGNFGEARELFTKGLELALKHDDKPLITNAIEGLADVACLNDPIIAARLMGFARITREKLGVAMSSNRAGNVDWCTQVVRDHLGHEWMLNEMESGSKLSASEAIRLALDAGTR